MWRGHWGSDRALLTRIPLLVLAAAIMAWCITLATDRMGAMLQPETPLAIQLVALSALILGAMVVYFALAFATGGARFGMIRRNLRRGRADGAPDRPVD